LAAAIHEELRRAAGAAEPYGLLLLESRFPSSWCEELAAGLRGDALLKDLGLGLIVNGGIQSEVQRDRLREVGYDFVLSTPLHPERLHEALTATVAGRVRDEGGATVAAPPPAATSAPTPSEDAAAAAPPADLVGQPPVFETPAADAAPAPPTPAPGFETRFSARILLVDENPASAGIHRTQLESLGCAVDTANTGFQTFEMAGHEAYDAILLDGDMQERDGYASVRSLRNREGTARRTPLIAMSVKASEIERQYYLAKDLDDCVKKPLDLEELRDVLRRWLPPSKQYMGGGD
jgi:CheY-like chemotaxis protein